MPLYEYECKKCGQTLEVIQKFSDEPLTKHPKCGGKLTKLISGAALQFKGTGWYITDYARSGAAAPEKPSESSGKSDDSASTKAETKTETKVESTPKKAPEKSSKSAAKAKKK